MPSIEILRVLKECSQLYFFHLARRTSAVKYKVAQPNPYDRIRKTILKLLNEYSKQTEPGMLGAGQRIYYSKGENEVTIKRVFKDTGFIGMLEGNDYENFDLVASFSGQIVDGCCSSSRAAPRADVCT